MPDFVVAGAPRCGTTSLHYYLRQHPQVCMSAIKEPNFFLFDADDHPHIAEEPIIRKSVRKATDYRALFRPTEATRVTGDVSPLYLYTRETPARLFAVCGVIRVVCLLRPPAERAWSHFLHAMPDVPADRRDELFAELVDAEMGGGPRYEPYRTRTHLVRLGRYGEQVARYEETFGAHNVLVLLTEDLEDDGDRALASVCSFIGVDDTVELAHGQRYNTTGAGGPAGWSVARKLVRRLQPALKASLPPRIAGRLAEVRASRLDAGAGPTPPIHPETERRITEWCADDVEALAARIDRDLSSWLGGPTATDGPARPTGG